MAPRPARIVLGLALLAILAVPMAAANTLPSADFEVRPLKPALGATLYFNSTSSDAEGPIENWTWSFGDGSHAYGPSVTHRFTEPRLFVVQLTVVDSEGATATKGRAIDLRPLEPAAALQLSSGLPPFLFWLMPLVVSVVLFALAYLVISKGQPAVYNLVLFLFFIASALKSLTEALAPLTAGVLPDVHDGAIAANRFLAYAYIPLFVWFVLVFPRPIAPWFRDGRRGVAALALGVPFLVWGFLPGTSAATIENVFNVFVAVVALACTGLLLYHAKSTDSDEERQRIRFLSLSFLLLVLSSTIYAGLSLTWTYYDAAGADAYARILLEATAVFGLILSPALELVAATVLMYAILRYQLLGIDELLVKAARGTFTALLVPSVFVILSNSVEQLFQVTVLAGVRFDYIVAGFVSALLMVPIQKWGQFLLFRFFPGLATTSAEEERQRRIEIFEAQLRYCLLDADLNAKELLHLRRLIGSIGITRDEVREVGGRVKKGDVSPLLPFAREPVASAAGAPLSGARPT